MLTKEILNNSSKINNKHLSYLNLYQEEFFCHISLRQPSQNNLNAWDISK